MNQNEKSLADLLSFWSENCKWLIVPLLLVILGTVITPSDCNSKYGCITNPYPAPRIIILEQQPSSGLASSNQPFETMPIVINNVATTVSSGSPFTGYKITNK